MQYLKQKNVVKQNKAQGTWGIRLLIHLFTAALTILIFWLLGFLVKDIGYMKGPDYAEIQRRHIDKSLLTQSYKTNNNGHPV